MNLPEKLIRNEQEQKELVNRMQQLQESAQEPKEGGEATPET